MAPETIAAAAGAGRISADTLVAVRDVEKYFPITAGVFSRHVADVKAVDGVTFDIKRGETLGLVGEIGLRQDDDRALHPALARADAKARSSSKAEAIDVTSTQAQTRCAPCAARCRSSSRIRTPASIRA